jgi:hypothetical protein
VPVRAEINIGERASIRLRCTLRRVARGFASAEALHCTARTVVIANEQEWLPAARVEPASGKGVG